MVRVSVCVEGRFRVSLMVRFTFGCGVGLRVCLVLWFRLGFWLGLGLHLSDEMGEAFRLG